jgi:hypothetical protein
VALADIEINIPIMNEYFDANDYSIDPIKTDIQFYYYTIN